MLHDLEFIVSWYIRAAHVHLNFSAIWMSGTARWYSARPLGRWCRMWWLSTWRFAAIHIGISDSNSQQPRGERCNLRQTRGWLSERWAWAPAASGEEEENMGEGFLSCPIPLQQKKKKKVLSYPTPGKMTPTPSRMTPTLVPLSVHFFCESSGNTGNVGLSPAKGWFEWASHTPRWMRQ